MSTASPWLPFRADLLSMVKIERQFMSPTENVPNRDVVFPVDPIFTTGSAAYDLTWSPDNYRL